MAVKLPLLLISILRLGLMKSRSGFLKKVVRGLPGRGVPPSALSGVRGINVICQMLEDICKLLKQRLSSIITFLFVKNIRVSLSPPPMKNTSIDVDI